jgi:predicted CXXCH cytochrome family protein
MEAATSQSVLGNFNNATFKYFGTTSRFYKRNGAYFVETANAQGRLEEFRISYTLGFYPLQQYLVEFPDGRIQALSISWDSRPKAEGGQRWYHLYPDEQITATDPLHWTGAFQNWNARCASCHTTNLAKNYSREINRYATKWSEMRVGCEACHGAGAKHLAWARGDRGIANKGLLTNIRKLWEPVDGHAAIPANLNPTANRQLEICGGCHSRRTELQQRDIAASFASNYNLTPLREGLYNADGQILNEVYEVGSFLQSRMYRNGVSCSNCHDPHSNALRVRGNGLCLQCHAAPKYQSQAHFFHKADSSGAQCVSCHMPTKTYMGVDRRRDHSFHVPDPAASVRLGVPNACTQCHADRTTEWASDFLAARSGRNTIRYPYAAVLAAARNGEADSAPGLLSIVGDESQAAILRATALLESSRFPSQRQLRATLAALRSPDALLRTNAAGALDFVTPTQRFQYLQPLICDPAKSVRMAVARHVADMPTGQVRPAQRARFAKLLSEYEQSLLFNADMPESMSELGLFHATRGEMAAAEQALLQARKLAPAYLPAMLNLADVYRAQGHDDRAEAVLAEALAAHPNSGDAHYAMGLLYVRAGRKPEALPLLRRAALLSPADPQYVYAYAVALAETGRRDEAARVLDAALQRFPDNSQLRDARANLK